MQTPVSALLFLASGPILGLLPVSVAGLLWGLASALCLVIAPNLPTFYTIVMVWAAAHLCRESVRLGCPGSWFLAIWWALCTGPLWIPVLQGSVQQRRLSDTPPGWTWWLWPANALTSPEWDPARQPPLYDTWGSQTAIPESLRWAWVVVLVLLSGSMYVWRKNRSSTAPAPGS